MPVVSRDRIILVAPLFKELAPLFSNARFAKLKRGLSFLASVFSVHRGKSSRFSLENRSEMPLFLEAEFSSLLLFLRNCIRRAASSFSNARFAKMKRGSSRFALFSSLAYRNARVATASSSRGPLSVSPSRLVSSVSRRSADPNHAIFEYVFLVIGS